MSKGRNLRFIDEIRDEFESSMGVTEQWRTFAFRFRQDFRTYLEKEVGATNVEISRGHFDLTGFFDIGGLSFYFSIGDVRWNKGPMLLRTAKDHKDYMGGSNGFVPIDDKETFRSEFERAVRSSLRVYGMGEMPTPIPNYGSRSRKKELKTWD